jgi:aryl-alcohol dehydrogenase-like predicted oxidoreductase
VEYRYLGRTGLKVSEFCLGAMTFGRESTEEVSRQMLDRFVDAGGIFVDTADVYSQGVSEDNLGASGWSLSEEQMNRLDQVSEHRLPYPYDVIARVQCER